MASKIEICNAALAPIRANSVTDIDSPTTNEEKLCNKLFDILAKELMTEGSWTSCITRQELVQTATTPEFDYLYEYQLPTDPECLRVLNINETDIGKYAHSIEGDKLLIDAPTCKIRYCFNNTNVGSWDTMLVKAMRYRLRAELIDALKGDDQKSQMAFNRAEAIVLDSLAINNQQGSSQEISSTSLLDDRS